MSSSGDAENTDMTACEGDGRPYAIPPTPRTYVTQSWKRPEMRREILSLLAHDYDWYLDRMLTGMYRERGWNGNDLDDCLSDVKVRFFAPTDAEMRSDPRRFWLDGWDRAKGPLRWYFLRCVRNFITDRWRRGKDEQAASGTSPIPVAGGGDDGFQPLDDGQTPEQAALAREFEVRFDKKIFIARALMEYEAECEAGGKVAADRGRVYHRYISTWPQPTMEDLAEMLGMTRFQVNNHIHQSRVRVMELFWLLVRSMEMDDTLADQAMLAMVGKLPPCRAKREVPKG